MWTLGHEVPLKCHVATQKGFEQQLSDRQEPSTSPLQIPWSEPLRAVTQRSVLFWEMSLKRVLFGFILNFN